jgi:hypothetical protein
VRAAAAALAASVLVAGCGGPNTADAVNVAATWLKAVQQRDGTAACKLMDASASRTLTARFALDAPPGDCGAVVTAYREQVGADALGEVVDAGLEANGTLKEGRLGVFPKDGPHELQVVLMHFDGRRWTVLSTSVGPA